LVGGEIRSEMRFEDPKGNKNSRSRIINPYWLRVFLRAFEDSGGNKFRSICEPSRAGKGRRLKKAKNKFKRAPVNQRGPNWGKTKLSKPRIIKTIMLLKGPAKATKFSSRRGWEKL
jgi:hypothetical protein